MKVEINVDDIYTLNNLSKLGGKLQWESLYELFELKGEKKDIIKWILNQSRIHIVY